MYNVAVVSVAVVAFGSVVFGDSNVCIVLGRVVNVDGIVDGIAFLGLWWLCYYC